MNEPTPKMKRIAEGYSSPRILTHRTSVVRAYAEGMLEAQQMILARVYTDGTAGGTDVVLDAIQRLFDE